MDYEALETVATLKGAKLDAALDEFEGRGLLLRDPDGEQYDLHPIVRQYAYDRLTDRAGVHGRLREYFEARPVPERVETLADLSPTIELYWHTVSAGRFDAACDLMLARLIPNPLYFRFGAYERAIELLAALFPDGEDQPPRLTSEGAQAWTLNALANSYSLSGQPRRAARLFEMNIAIREKLDVDKNVAVGLGNLADDQLKLGWLNTAEANLRRRIELCRAIEDEF
jgi:tetratricopeptide (TPR) repeat protein